VWSSSAYSELGNLVLSRVTLFNARRRGEPARLTLSEWQVAASDQWLNSASVSSGTEVEQQLFRELKITYQADKGNNHLVLVLFPSDTVQAMEKLMDQTVREFAGIHPDNAYAFPNLKHSKDHVSGWHSIHSVSTVTSDESALEACS